MRNVKIRQGPEKYDLLLFVTGMSVVSIKAIENIKAVCDKYLKNRYTLEIIDIYKKPEILEEYDIIASPTLVKKSPMPIKRLIGDMSDTGKLLAGLGLNTIN